MHGAENLDKKLKRASQIKCPKQPRPYQIIYITLLRENALGVSRISAYLVGNTRTLLAALSYKAVAMLT